MSEDPISAPKGGLSNLTQRILVAVVAIPLIVYLVLFKPISLLGLLLIVGLLSVHELYGLAKAKGLVPLTYIGLTTAGAIILSFAHFRLGVTLATTDIITVILCLALPIILTAELVRGYPNPIAQTSITIGGALYAAIGVGSFYGIHEYFFSASAAAGIAPDVRLSFLAGSFLLTLLASIWICDTAAFGFGKWLGKHKIAPRISPNKSWEGGIAGALFAVLTWIAAWAWVPQLNGLSLRTALVMGIIAGVIGQIGDFAESQLKRDAGVKDSSALIPGHGGMLDRIDSLLFVSPIAFVYLHLFGL